ncbi:MAG TPA: hypothetical protein VFZ59_22480 [Verrucomicrobiae bacterium]|nr:hypothetical protein [Verrucomicrobiae bacterium]
MPAERIIQLRELLSEKFPTLRTRLNDVPATGRFWPTGMAQLDQPLGGGFPKGAFTEINSRDQHSGSATLLRSLLHRAASENQIVALVDGADSLDVTQLDEAALTRLLWVRCRSGDEAMRAADLLLRDSNLSLLMLDLINVPDAQLRRISPTTWYRFQRLVEETSTICLVFTPRPMVSPAEARITIQSHFSLNALDVSDTDLLHSLRLEVSTTRQLREIEQQKTA